MTGHQQDFLDRLNAWRSLPDDVQLARMTAGSGSFKPSSQPDRGRLRVGLWAPCLGLGGAEAWMALLTRSVDPDRISWRGLVITDSDHALSAPMVENFAAQMPVGYGREASAVLASECDVVVSWSILGLSEVITASQARPRLVQVLHFPEESARGPIADRVIEEADQVVGVSSPTLGHLSEASRSRARVIGNAVDPAKILAIRSRDQVRASWGVPGDVPVVGFLGRLSAEKQPFAMAELDHHLPDDFHIVIVGDGVKRPALQAMASPRMHVVGPDPDSGSVLGAIDCLASPSLYESFGLSMAEALWAGVPLVATQSGFLRDRPDLARIIPTSVTGPEFALAVVRDFEDREGTDRRSAAGLMYARDRFAAARFGSEWTELLCSTAIPRSARLALVSGCPDRGPVLPLSLQDDCGCQGRELSECRGGKGHIAGRVTLRDCLSCVSGGGSEGHREI